jgi:hypothetical protein
LFDRNLYSFMVSPLQTEGGGGTWYNDTKAVFPNIELPTYDPTITD